jgi:hypothetical protein
MNRFNTYEEFLNEALDPLNHLTQEQVDWCDKHIKGEWGVNEKGEVTVSSTFDRSVVFKDRSFDRFPVQFANVKGDFDCFNCENLVSLKGAPDKVGGNFYCGCCPKLTSLKGAPKEVGGKFSCRVCDKLVSLKGAPQEVKGDFDCDHCENLVSLEGAPQRVGGGFVRVNCPKLPDWETDLIEDYMKNHRTWEEVWKMLHKETYRRAARLGLI